MATKKKKYDDEDEFDESEDAESDITESDFEDPDEMEVSLVSELKTCQCLIYTDMVKHTT